MVDFERNIRQTSASESRLLSGLRSGDPCAFEQVNRQYRSRLHRAALKILRNVQDAEDAVQETLVRAFVKIDTFDSRSSLYTWLTRILINCCLGQLRASRKYPVLSLDENVGCGDTTWAEMLASDAWDAEDVLIVDEQVSALREAVRRLRPDLRLILTARHLDNMPLGKVALRLGLSLSATNSRALRARRICASNVRQLMASDASFLPGRKGARA
jgi:RNA polymerase sigma-70 factor (ECF subfamily)